MTERTVIVGAGHGGTTAAVELRARGYEGEVVLLSDEPVEPYERPPLSKDWLTRADGARDPLHGAAALAERGVDLRLGARAARLDRAARMVHLEDGEAVPYTHAILATGSLARRLPLPGAEADGVHGLRTAADAAGLRDALAPGARLVVIGAGYIGLEVAASARGRGAEVTVIELADRPMARTASAPVSAFYRARHEAEGVRFVMPSGVAAIEAPGGRATGVRLTDGTVLPADAVLIAAGGVPDTALAEAAGLATEGGVATDEAGRTDDPSVFAIGDAARRPTPWADAPLRLESVHSALEMARLAAAAITGTKPPALVAPWFWSDQYDLKLQIAGLVGAEAGTLIVREGGDALSVFHVAGERLLAVEAINDPRAYMTGRTALTRGQAVDAAILADPARDPKDALIR